MYRHFRRKGTGRLFPAPASADHPMNRLRYAVSLSYEVMDPMADFLLNIEAARTPRQ